MSVSAWAATYKWACPAPTRITVCGWLTTEPRLLHRAFELFKPRPRCSDAAGAPLGWANLRVLNVWAKSHATICSTVLPPMQRNSHTTQFYQAFTVFMSKALGPSIITPIASGASRHGCRVRDATSRCRSAVAGSKSWDETFMRFALQYHFFASSFVAPDVLSACFAIRLTQIVTPIVTKRPMPKKTYWSGLCCSVPPPLSPAFPAAPRYT